MKKARMLSVQVVLVAVLGVTAQAAFSPWGTLTANSWVDPNSVTIHTVNGVDYPVKFKKTQTGTNSASGMNALTFGSTAGHLQSSALTGSFSLKTTGNTTFTDVVLVVAINSNSLPADFTFSLGRAGQTAYQFNPVTDFGFYDPSGYVTGRPSGYYSGTSPTSEGIAYNFSSGMVTALAIQGASLSSTNPITINYAFGDLPGTAVFSVYGYDATPTVLAIQHTNRAVVDANNPNAAVSTFEVVPEPSMVMMVIAGTWISARRRR